MFKNARSVRQKLLLVVVTTTMAALVITGVAMVVYDLRTYQEAWVNDLLTQADILGRASAPALAFDDHKTARENLSLLKARPQITAAAIYTSKGTIFASYGQDGTTGAQFPALPEADGYHIDGKELVVFQRVVDNNEILGTIYLRARYELFERLKSYLGILSVVMIASLLAAAILSYWLSSVVTKPILAISDVARQVMASRDFTLRATKTTEDEIGSLADGFNGMLAEIGRRAEVLEESNRNLEYEMAERHGVEEALRTSELRNRTLVSATTSIVWTADGNGRFNEDQPSWEAYTGQGRDQYGRLGWRDAFAPDDRRDIELKWAQIVAEPAAFDLELGMWHEPSQRHRKVSFRAVPIIGLRGEIQEWIGTVTDIDDQRRAEEDLQKLNTELERRVAERTAQLEGVNKELEGFSYSVSHDLRAPLRAILGFSSMLAEDHAGQLDEEALRKLGIVRNEAQRMSVLIDDLLTFSRLGRQAIQRRELDMRNLASGMFDRLQAQSAGPKAEFRLGSLPVAMGDRVLLEQVWANFLSNALKFSAKREQPVIEVGAISDGAEHIYFVRDNGAGFDPRYQSKLFGVFQRLHDNAEFAGTGVGLALVERIVTRHGGRVWADGKPDEGATFYFTLPKEQRDGAG
jgi:signal transduction histidine kinase